MLCYKHWTIGILLMAAAARTINIEDLGNSVGTQEATEYPSLFSQINSPVWMPSARKRSIPGYGQLGGIITGPEHLTARLTNMIMELKSLVHADHFDTPVFDRSKFTFESRIAECSSWANEKEVSDKSISAQILYATNLFLFLEDSVELLKFYSSTNSEAHKLITQLIRINMRLVLQFDSYGNPDSKKDGYANMVVDTYAKIWDISDQFMSLEDVSLGLRVAFNNQIASAENTVSMLANRLPF